MSVVLDAAQKIHQTQLGAAAKSEELLIAAAGRADAVADRLRALAPSLSARIAGPVGKVTAPVEKVVGSPAELRAHAAQSAQDWLRVQQSFQRTILSAVLPDPAPVQQADARVVRAV